MRYNISGWRERGAECLTELQLAVLSTSENSILREFGGLREEDAGRPGDWVIAFREAMQSIP